MDTYKTGARLVRNDTDIMSCDILECPKCHTRIIDNLGRSFFDPEYVTTVIKKLSKYNKYAADLVLYWDIGLGGSCTDRASDKK